MLKSLLTFLLAFSVVLISLLNDEEVSVSKYYFEGEVSPKERDLYFERLISNPNTKEFPIENILASKNFVKKSVLKSSFKKKNGLLSNYQWKVRGPYQIGGRVRAFAYDIRDENRLLAAGASGGMWLSTNGGENWRKVTKPTDNHSVSCLVQDTRQGKEDTWYYGTGERIASKFRYGYGIYKSTDNGETWEICSGTSNNNQRGSWDNPFDFVFRIVVDPTASNVEDVLVVSTALGGIQRSSNGGETWTKVLGSNFGNASSAFSEVAVTSDGVFYATLSKYTNSGQYNAPLHGIYRSENGIDWTKINHDEYTQNYSRIVLGINPSNENEVYFFAITQEEGKQTFNHAGDELWHSLYKYTYLSDDGSFDGGEWTDLSMNLPKLELNRQQTNSQGGYNMVIKVHPDDPQTILIGDINVWRSTDGFTSNDNYAIIGGTCKEPDNSCDYHYRYPNHHSDVHEFLFSKSDSKVLYTGTDGGVHKTLDLFSEDVEWISLNNGFFTTQFYDIGIARSATNNFDVLGGMQDNGTLFTNVNESGHYWTDVLRGDGFNNEIANDGSFIITSKNSTPQPKINIWKSILDNNGRVEATRRIDPIGGRDFNWNTAFALDPNSNDNLYVAGGGILWRQNRLTEIELTDEKDSISFGWDSLTHTFVENYNWNSPRSGETITAVSVSKNPSNIVYYGTSQGRVYRINKANEGDPVPINLNVNGLPIAGNINCIAINPNDADDIIVVFSSYSTKSLYHSKDGGNSWEDISGTLEEYSDGSGGGPAVQWVDILPIGDDYLYFAGTSDGLFVTSILLGEYTPWQIEAIDIIGTSWVSSINSRQDDGFVAVGTYSQGVYDAIINTLPEKASKPSILTKSYIDVLDTLTISWSEVKEANVYNVELSENPDFEGEIIEFFTKENSIKLNDLGQGFKTYYARISSVNAGGYSEYSELIDITTYLSKPNTIYPLDSETEIPVNLEISWDEVESATEYRFQLNTFNVFTNPRIDTVINTNKIIVNLEPNRNYRWRVSAIKDDKQGLYSDVFLFKTSNVNSIGKADDYELYPNPSSNLLNIKLKDRNLTQSIKISVYNNNGKLVFKSNKYLDKIDVSKFEVGNYFLILENKNHKVYKKFIVNR